MSELLNSAIVSWKDGKNACPLSAGEQVPVEQRFRFPSQPASLAF